jgi:hypothetical protein
LKVFRRRCREVPSIGPDPGNSSVPNWLFQNWAVQGLVGNRLLRACVFTLRLRPAEPWLDPGYDPSSNKPANRNQRRKPPTNELDGLEPFRA